MEKLSPAYRDRYGRRVLKAVTLLLLAVTFARAEWIELTDGTRVEGAITAVSSEAVIMDVQTSPSVIERKSYPRGDVAKIQRATQDDIAFAEVSQLQVPSTADGTAVYDTLLEKFVRPFMKNYAYSKHMPAARKLAEQLETERGRVEAGDIKIDGQWIDAATRQSDAQAVGARLLLAKMKDAADPAAALSTFDQLEKKHESAPAFPDALRLAQAKITQLRSDVIRMQADLTRREASQAEGLKLASEDRRLLMQKGIDQDRAAIQARITQAKQSGSKWPPLVADKDTLAELAKLADTERARLAKLDIASMDAGVAAAQRAREHLDAGDTAAAEASLSEAEKLWSKNSQIATLREALKENQKKSGEPTPPATKP